ncbi:MAG: thermopsin family protease, partial [Thermoprotei archaeon]
MVTPNLAVHAQTSQTTSSVSYLLNVTETLPGGYYYYYPFNVPNTSPNATFGYYFVVSNATVTTAMMTAQQFNAFNTTGTFSGGYIADQNGTESFDGMLFSQGDYYLVVYAYQTSAQVQIYLDVKSNVEATNATTYFGEFMTLNPQSQLKITLHYSTLGSPFNLTLFGASNQSVQYTLTDNLTGKVVLTSPLETITNLNISPFTYNYTLTDLLGGVYQLTVGNPHNTSAYVYVEYRVNPQYVNPYLTLSRNWAPMGIVSYGVLNNSGAPIPYEVDTSSVLGYANITSILAYNQTAAQQAHLPDPYMASLQLNLVLFVLNKDGSFDVYWPQNTPLFYTDKSFVLLHDSVLNITGDNAYLTNSTITSPNGYVVTTKNRNQTQYYYGNYINPPSINYMLPFAFELLMNSTVLPNRGVSVAMGIKVFQNGSVLSNPHVLWFDNITIDDPEVSQALFAISGYRYTPTGTASLNGIYYDAELVFGGGSNGEITLFQKLSAVLGLYYYNSTYNNYTSFPSYYSFGADTAEATSNVHVDYLGGGLAQLSVGTPDFTYLAPTSTSTPTTPTTTTTTSTSTTSTRTSTPTPTPTTTATTLVTTTSTTISTTTPTLTTAQSGSAAAGLAFLAVIIIVVVAVAYLL